MKSFVVFSLLLLTGLFVYGCMSEPQLAMPTPSPSPVPSYTYHEPSPTPSVHASVQASVAASRAPSPTPQASFKLSVDSSSAQYAGDAFKVFVANNVGEKIKFYSMTVNGSGELAVQKALESGAQTSLILSGAAACGDSAKTYTAIVKFEYQKYAGSAPIFETHTINGYCS
jgi:hypothetical protein